jgi:SAM-dependent methyltransferase
MATTDKLFAGSIPELYERFLVPLIFESYARDLAKRVAEAAPKDVLETAAGTGVLTRAMTARLPAAARIVATDLNQSMLDQAAKRQDGDRRIERRPADALALPFPAASFDVVACQFGTIFFPDKIAGYKEARRVLRSGGHLIFNVWDRISENEFADIIEQALAALFPDDPPRHPLRLPRCRANQAGAEHRGLCGDSDRRGEREKQSAVAARCGRRFLRRNAAAQ